jgi:hypothetical protein
MNRLLQPRGAAEARHRSRARRVLSRERRRAAPVTGHLVSDREMVFRVAPAPGAAKPPHPADANGAVYTWAFGGEPARAEN